MALEHDVEDCTLLWCISFIQLLNLHRAISADSLPFWLRLGLLLNCLLLLINLLYLLQGQAVHLMHSHIWFLDELVRHLKFPAAATALEAGIFQKASCMMACADSD